MDTSFHFDHFLEHFYENTPKSDQNAAEYLSGRLLKRMHLVKGGGGGVSKFGAVLGTLMLMEVLRGSRRFCHACHTGKVSRVHVGTHHHPCPREHRLHMMTHVSMHHLQKAHEN